jgi:hypothetical protein
MVLQNKRGEYLFTDENYDDTVHFTLVDRNGSIIRAADLPITLETFVRCMYKAGYQKVDF